MIYKTLKAKFEEQLRLIPAVKSVDWYNEQYMHTESEQVEAYPAVYIEIMDPVNWITAGDKMQHATVSVRLHVVMDTLSVSPEPVMDLTQTIFLQINDKAFDENAVEITSRWIRIATDFPKRYRKLKVMKVVFEAEVYDFVAMDALTPVEDVIFNIPTT